ncbi:MAG TPA: hypothetical protein VN428_27160 [Bryobacteraceae bacterium]|nr:hypothetical protein [Bryobacteraceae bacterium]
MFPQGSNDQQRLEQYLAAHPRFAASPVPAPVDRNQAASFIAKEAPGQQEPPNLRKLVALAVLYDIREAAPAFGALLKQNEKDEDDIARSSLALVALAWIGDSRQWEFAQRYYRWLTDRSDPERDARYLLEACDALGVREGTAYHRQWVGARLARIEQDLKSAGQSKGGPPPAYFENRANELREYLAMAVTRIDQGNNLKARVEGIAPEGRVGGLTALYLGDPDLAGITPELSYWAGMTLVRLAAQVANARSTAILELSKYAQKYAAAGGEGLRGKQLELLRARALRAVDFLGGQLDQASREWLAAQKDAGTDPLALRPNWNYGQQQAAPAL